MSDNKKNVRLQTEKRKLTRLLKSAKKGLEKLKCDSILASTLATNVQDSSYNLPDSNPPTTYSDLQVPVKSLTTSLKLTEKLSSITFSNVTVNVVGLGELEWNGTGTVCQKIFKVTLRFVEEGKTQVLKSFGIHLGDRVHKHELETCLKYLREKNEIERAILCVKQYLKLYYCRESVLTSLQAKYKDNIKVQYAENNYVYKITCVDISNKFHFFSLVWTIEWHTKTMCIKDCCDISINNKAEDYLMCVMDDFSKLRKFSGRDLSEDEKMKIWSNILIAVKAAEGNLS